MDFFRILLLLFAVGSLHAAPFTTPDGWLLSTEFPSEPKVSPARTAGDVVQTTAICDGGSSAFIVIRAEYPAEIPKENIGSVYDAGRDAMLKSMSADLVREEKITIGGYEGRHYVVEAKSRTRRAESKVVIIGSELYQVMFATKEALGTKAAVIFFSKIEVREKKG